MEPWKLDHGKSPLKKSILRAPTEKVHLPCSDFMVDGANRTSDTPNLPFREKFVALTMLYGFIE